MDSGFGGGEDESYNVYDQPFRGSRDMASNIYRPSRNVDKDAYKDDFDTLMQNNRYAGVTQVLNRSKFQRKYDDLYNVLNMSLSLGLRWHSLLPEHRLLHLFSPCPYVFSQKYTFFLLFLSTVGLSQTKTSWVPITGKGGKGPFSLKRIPSVLISSWKKPSSTVAPRGPQQAAAPKTTTTTKSVGRSERQIKAAASMLAEVVCTLSVVQGCF